MKPYLFIFVILCGSGCSYFKSTPASPQVLDLTINPALVSIPGIRLTEQSHHFYEGRSHGMAWHNNTGKTAAADSMIALVHDARHYGLIADDYHRHTIDSLITLPLSQATATALDVYLSDAFFGLWHELRHGRVKVKVKDTVRSDLTAFRSAEAIVALNSALAKNTLRQCLASREPAAHEYSVLKHTLRTLLRRPGDSLSVQRAQQIVVNMERWRWQASRPDHYIAVNVPAYTLSIVENDSVVVESKVITGRPDTPTPELESVIRSFIIYPYWHVPKSIVKEILPQIQADTFYLRRHNYDVLNAQGKPVSAKTINWAAYNADNFPFTLRQREGSENTMGIIKFIFNNRYGVYLHDTNARGLFSLPQRALSHGCVRVHKAVALARYLIKDDHVVSPEDLDQYLMLQHRMEIRLIRPMPLYLQYFTCEVKNGEVVFHADVYGKDQALINVLYRKQATLVSPAL